MDRTIKEAHKIDRSPTPEKKKEINGRSKKMTNSTEFRPDGMSQMNNCDVPYATKDHNGPPKVLTLNSFQKLCRASIIIGLP